MPMRICCLLVLAAARRLDGGARSIEPWVKPYEREHLADPIMSFDRNPDLHRRTSTTCSNRAKARAAPPASAGGGCGCN